MYGPQGSERDHGAPKLPWDLNYAQFGVLEHARHRFLSLAEAVVNADVDELVVTKAKVSIFELVSRSETGISKLSWFLDRKRYEISWRNTPVISISVTAP